MTVAATMPLVAVSVLAWAMIGLPIVLAVGVGVAHLLGPRRSTAEAERAQQAADSDAPGPAGPTGRLPGA
jgi:hypothetical protein